MLVCSSPMKSRNRLVHGVGDTYATRADFICNPENRDFQIQNGGAHVRVFVTFKCQLLII